MSEETATRPQIRIVPERSGHGAHLELISSPFIEALRSANRTWSTPIFVVGAGREEEIHEASKIKFNNRDIFHVQNLRSFSNYFGWRRDFLSLLDIFDEGEYSVEYPLDGGIDEEFLLNLAQKKWSRPSHISNIEAEVARLSNSVDNVLSTTAVRISLPSRRSLMPAYVLSRWIRRPQKWPFIVDIARDDIVQSFGFEFFPARRIRFEYLVKQVSSYFGMADDAVTDAYKVWQLSRDGPLEKYLATTPELISFKNANSFVKVLAGAKPRPPASAKQIAAPVMFDDTKAIIDVQGSKDTDDKHLVVKAAAEALLFQIGRFEENHFLTNVLPSASVMFERICVDLRTIASASYDDGVVVGAAMNMEALQWHIDAVKESLTEHTLGELAGLFSTAFMFFNRFPTWREYRRAENETLDEGLDVSKVRQLLSKAAIFPDLLTQTAQTRVSVVVSNAPTDNSPPPLIHGMILTGDNLAAATVNKIGSAAGEELGELGKTVKLESYKIGTKAAIDFAVENAETLIAVANARKWAWAGWAISVVRSLLH